MVLNDAFFDKCAGVLSFKTKHHGLLVIVYPFGNGLKFVSSET